MLSSRLYRSARRCARGSGATVLTGGLGGVVCTLGLEGVVCTPRKPFNTRSATTGELSLDWSLDEDDLHARLSANLTRQ